MSSVVRLKAQIEGARRDLAVAESRVEDANGRVDRAVERIREVLKCRPGGEKAALKKLRAEVEKAGEAFESALDEAEEDLGDE